MKLDRARAKSPHLFATLVRGESGTDTNTCTPLSPSSTPSLCSVTLNLGGNPMIDLYSTDFLPLPDGLLHCKEARNLISGRKQAK